MPVSQITRGTPLMIPSQPVPNTRHPSFHDTIRPLQRDTVTSQPPPDWPGSLGPGRTCWSLDVKVSVLLVTVAGALVLILLYRVLQLRHRLRLAQAGHFLEYYGFYHAGTYTLKEPTVRRTLHANGDAANPVHPIPATPLPAPPTPTPLPVPKPPTLRQPPPLPLPSPLPPSLLPLSTSLSLPLPLPIIHTTPPSPHLSWGASSDVEVYSRIGAFRPSRLSSLSHSQVILFEHSSL
ncbi:hypothetical protein DPEC_G00324090 [Dallia pectoralis]|uniref:Uncharacterized protein n=1 Tax=Dallia pectoralis TaxID=75939 RepID=A0ACC2FAY3_DALPE|nr:hypothetical protein DPEC_G00324090 [Dallia pectoralis]